jgi:hypothetical protein
VFHWWAQLGGSAIIARVDGSARSLAPQLVLGVVSRDMEAIAGSVVGTRSARRGCVDGNRVLLMPEGGAI